LIFYDSSEENFFKLAQIVKGKLSKNIRKIAEKHRNREQRRENEMAKFSKSKIATSKIANFVLLKTFVEEEKLKTFVEKEKRLDTVSSMSLSSLSSSSKEESDVLRIVEETI